MEKFEDLMMRVSRVFGLGLMSLTLAGITICMLVLIVNFLGSAFSSETPQASFKLSDFAQVSAETMVDAKPLVTPEREMAEDAVEDIRSAYMKRLNNYVTAQEKMMFMGDDAAEKKAEYIRKYAADFEAGSINTIINYSVNYDEKYRESFIDGIADYLLDAEDEGLESFSYNNIPLQNIANSQVFNQYVQQYNKDMSRINKEREEREGPLGMAIRAGIVMTVFMLVLIFLMLGVMFAIIRIEKKMKQA